MEEHKDFSIELNKFDDVDEYALYGMDYERRRRKEFITNRVIEFYHKVKNNPNVLSPDEIINFKDNRSWWSRNATKNKIILWKDKKAHDNEGTDFLKLWRDQIIFGLKSGFIFINSAIYYLYKSNYKSDWGVKQYGLIEIYQFLLTEGHTQSTIFSFKKNSIIYKELHMTTDNETIMATKEDIELFKQFLNYMKDTKERYDLEVERINYNIKIGKSLIQKEFQKSKELILKELDKDNDNQIDLVENDFNKLLSKNQNIIIDIDKNYVHQFVKISNYIQTKQKNLQVIFGSLSDAKNEDELTLRADLIRDQINTYNLLVFHSINMIGALLKNDLVVFYEIYESFDKLGIFNSNWENEVSEKLTNIGDNLNALLDSIYEMEQSITAQMSHLTYVTEESFKSLNQSTTKLLEEVGSTMGLNNLLNVIQTYEQYKINKNTHA